jgi:hypothetical protein
VKNNVFFSFDVYLFKCLKLCRYLYRAENRCLIFFSESFIFKKMQGARLRRIETENLTSYGWLPFEVEANKTTQSTLCAECIRDEPLYPHKGNQMDRRLSGPQI